MKDPLTFFFFLCGEGSKSSRRHLQGCHLIGSCPGYKAFLCNDKIPPCFA